MFNAGVMTIQEFAMAESVPLEAIHREVLELLRDRDGVVVFGAQAVNAYVPQNDRRTTADVDVLALNAGELAEHLQHHLARCFNLAIRIRKARGEVGFRVYQLRKEGNRHLVDIRAVSRLPSFRRIHGVPVISPEDLVAMKVLAHHARKRKLKGMQDLVDTARLLLHFPHLKKVSGPVAEKILSLGGGPAVLATWAEVVDLEVELDGEQDELEVPFSF